MYRGMAIGKRGRGVIHTQEVGIIMSKVLSSKATQKRESEDTASDGRTQPTLQLVATKTYRDPKYTDVGCS